MKTKLLVTIIPILVIMGIVTVYIVISLTALNPSQPLAQTTPAEPQTTIPSHLQTTIVQGPATKTIYLNDTPPAIPEQFAAEISAFSQGVQLDVGVNDTTPRVGGAVLVVIRMTNVNSSEPVGFFGSLSIHVFNSEGVRVDGISILFRGTPLSPGYVEFPINQTFTQVWVWKVEPLPNSNMEFRPGESYNIVVACGFQTRGAHRFGISSTPIQVTIS